MLRPWCAFDPNAFRFSGRALSFLILVLTATTWLAPASAQENRRAAPGTVIIPSTNHVGATDRGLKAHTNLRLVIPPDVRPSEAPPYSGYGYETPASLACVYRVVQPIRGCNPNSTVNVPNGGSQTIAVVDAFDDPNAAADLAYFSSQFGLPFSTSKFKVIYAQGTKPGVDPTGGWELEEALDIEYSHAMAPHAMLYLVEANSNSFSDLVSAVLVAANLVRCGKTTTCPSNASGKGEVSMSWGSGEFDTETNYDWVFTAPNVVYLSATGDVTGPSYPSVSPNVIAVGGTSTARSLNTGNLIQEIAWSDGGGGLSFYEPVPPYQSSLPSWLTQGARATPDISADANPSNGYWVYVSYPIAGQDNPSNWWIVGGTSASNALLTGIINAGATASGQFAASTHAELTRLYNDYANSSTYHANLWDITYGACNYYSGTFSVGGYDLCTGLGSPKGLAGK
jgi:kumamolisin